MQALHTYIYIYIHMSYALSTVSLLEKTSKELSGPVIFYQQSR